MFVYQDTEELVYLLILNLVSFTKFTIYYLILHSCSTSMLCTCAHICCLMCVKYELMTQFNIKFGNIRKQYMALCNMEKLVMIDGVVYMFVINE